MDKGGWSIMSIYLYSGTPGSGKSYEAVNIVFANLKKGLYVIANFAVNFTEKEIKKGYPDRFFYCPNNELTIEYLIRFAIDKCMIENQREHQAMVIIDEAGGKFNTRDFKNSDRSAWIDFFTQHMKMGFDFILVAQMDRMIDRQIRGCIESEFKFRQVNRFGPFAFLPFKLFIKVEYWYGVRERVGADFIIFRMKKAQRYNRYKMFSGFKLSSELMKLIENIQDGEIDEEFKKPIDVIYDEVEED